MADPTTEHGAYNLQPFRRAVFRGLGLVLPPLLTFVILLWIANSVERILNPIESATRSATVWFINDTKTEVPDGAELNQLAKDLMVDLTTKGTVPATTDPVAREADSRDDLQQLIEAVSRIERRLDVESGLVSSVDSVSESRQDEPEFLLKDTVYVWLGNGEWIPKYVRDSVENHVRQTGTGLSKNSGRGYYDHFVQHSILKRTFVIPVFFAGFILLMYLLGKFLAAGVGRYFWNLMESLINQLPIIRTVYSSVKQVTDFFVGETEVNEFQRVVAIEYPRKGIWSIGFVTGESLLTIRGAADGEAIVSILMPTSPVPGTGFTITARKSETIDLDIPIEQALQFVVSCGVVIPDGEVQEMVHGRIQAVASELGYDAGGGIAVEQ